MEIYINNDEYLSKTFPFHDILDSIKDRINKINDNYIELNKNYKNDFIFPINDYQKLNEFIDKIKNNNTNINEEIYESINSQLKIFSQKIKESSYEKNIFNKIKENNSELIKLNNRIYTMQMNNMFKKKLDSSENIDIFEQENNNTKDYSKNFYSSNNSLTNNTESNYLISLKCSSYDCGNDVKYICKNHCYKYFCEKCKNDFDEESYSHQFEEIYEEEENLKITFINSFLYLIKTYVEKSDNIFKDNNKINYPILKDFDKFDSQKDFLNAIFNYNNDNKKNNINKRNNYICDSIKNSIVKTFELDVPTLEIIDKNFDDMIINENLVIPGKNKEKQKNMNKLNKLDKMKLIIKKNYKKFFDDNIQRYDYLTDYKNIINKLIINEMHITKEKLNSKYNFIIPNLEQTSINNISYYNWFGFGLNYENIWKIEENEENSNIPKAIAFYGFNNKMTSDEIKLKLYNIIMNKSLKKNPNLCIYLYHNLNEVEKNTGVINFDNKKYYIALMARILPNKKRQSNKDTWAVRPNEIEFISIMFKEIKV